MDAAEGSRRVQRIQRETPIQLTRVLGGQDGQEPRLHLARAWGFDKDEEPVTVHPASPHVQQTEQALQALFG